MPIPGREHLHRSARSSNLRASTPNVFQLYRDAFMPGHVEPRDMTERIVVMILAALCGVGLFFMEKQNLYYNAGFFALYILTPLFLNFSFYKRVLIIPLSFVLSFCVENYFSAGNNISFFFDGDFIALLLLYFGGLLVVPLLVITIREKLLH